MTTDTMRLAERMQHVGMSPTMKGTIEAERLRKQGVDVVDLGAGEPDFPTPPHVTAAAHAAIDKNFTKYTANMGTADLREAVGFRYREDYGVSYAADEVIITAGGKQALIHAAFALFGPGDDVITHVPGWPTLVEQIKLAEATPVIVRTHVEDGFRITADLILAAVTPRTKGIIINSPGNPTGALISEADVDAIAGAAAKRGIWVLLDLCYDRLVYDPVPHNIIGVLSRRLRDRAVLCGSASKAYAMTGWRCGWVVGPKELIGACNAIQSHSTSNACSISQRAAEAALRGPQECVTEMLDEYRRRRDQLHTWLSADPRIRMVKPAGAFYMFPDVSDFLSPDGLRTSGELAAALLTEAHVAVTPGEAFDAPGFLRISYATSMKELERGSQRILEFLASRSVRAASV
jgi:aspartate aminotransferase